MKKNSVILGNSEEILPTLPSNFVDFIFTGPPYHGAKMGKEYELDLLLVGREIKRVLKSGGVCAITTQDFFVKGGKSLVSFKMAIDWVENIGLKFWADYVYWRGAPKKTIWYKHRPRLDHDFIFVFVNGNKPNVYRKVIDGTILDYRYQWMSTKRPKGMSTPFPNALAHDMVRTYSEKGQLVLDPFCGSGTTLVEAKRLKRDYLGIEIAPEVYEFAISQLEGERGLLECF